MCSSALLMFGKNVRPHTCREKGCAASSGKDPQTLDKPIIGLREKSDQEEEAQTLTAQGRAHRTVARGDKSKNASKRARDRRDIDTDRQADRQACAQASTKKNERPGRGTSRQTGRQVGRHAGGQTNTQGVPPPLGGRVTPFGRDEGDENSDGQFVDLNLFQQQIPTRQANAAYTAAQREGTPQRQT